MCNTRFKKKLKMYVRSYLIRLYTNRPILNKFNISGVTCRPLHSWAETFTYWHTHTGPVRALVLDTTTFPFWVFGEAVTWLTEGLPLGLFVFHLKAQGTDGQRCDCQLGLLTAYHFIIFIIMWSWSWPSV